MWHVIWIAAASLVYCMYAICTKWANEDPDSWKWVFVLYFLGAIQVWPLVAKYSKNLVFDGFLYDFVIFWAFFLTLFAVGGGTKFTWVQWIGAAVVMIGFVLLKAGAK